MKKGTVLTAVVVALSAAGVIWIVSRKQGDSDAKLAVEPEQDKARAFLRETYRFSSDELRYYLKNDADVLSLPDELAREVTNYRRGKLGFSIDRFVAELERIANAISADDLLDADDTVEMATHAYTHGYLPSWAGWWWHRHGNDTMEAFNSQLLMRSKK